jgi:hypothetical protein
MEVGLLLTVLPWSTFWDRNYFIGLLPALRVLLDSSYLRGAVTGLGLVALAAGFAELHALMPWRRR